MNMMQIGILGVAGALLAIQIKQVKSEFAVYICIAIGILVFMSVAGQLKSIVDTVKMLTKTIDLDNSYITILLKMLGITYVAEFSSGICKDAGFQTIASQIEIFSKISILVLSVPILVALIQTIQGFWS